MGDRTGIEWTDATWNPVTGCTKVSPGCDHCYALTLAERFRGTPGHYFENGFDVQLRPDKLDQPLRWKKPRRIFVNSMSDLFHDDIPDEYIARVFAVMALAEQHTFQVLTKRHGRMRSLLGALVFESMVRDEVNRLLDDGAPWPPTWEPEGQSMEWPLPHVWLGVSVEDQRWADIRIPALLDTPAAVRFLSCEPLIGPVRLSAAWIPIPADFREVTASDLLRLIKWERHIDWVIAGGESGRDARPMHPDWARSLRDQCQAAGVPFLFKQWGEFAALPGFGTDHGDLPPAAVTQRVGKKAAGRELDGRTHDDFPGGA